MPSATDVLDWNQLRGLTELQVDGDPDIVGQVIEMFREDGPARLARARHALEHGDGTALRLEAHSLRGTAGLIGATALRSAATAVERAAEAGDLAGAGSWLATMDRAMDEVLAALTAV